MRKVERDMTEKAVKTFGKSYLPKFEKATNFWYNIYIESKRDITLNFIKHFMGRDQREKEKRI